ncbi:hypothetical protein GcM3_095035 [Golovinomyces cichoracearum]|uniref:Uncharacterized protein n=1 Tax=Golovinomyces cichoracearum TaxID=62708 RepID=A0A420IFF1_9PEZI|nr:hypothetical protein GcM3_095035 [Golovinomyces cichoracearum]
MRVMSHHVLFHTMMGIFLCPQKGSPKYSVISFARARSYMELIQCLITGSDGLVVSHPGWVL